MSLQGSINKLKTGSRADRPGQLAFANTIQGFRRGANYLDATLYGLGRGAGNCNLELLLGFLQDRGYDVRPVYDVIASHILPLQKEIAWGYSVPHLVTGILNCRPEEGLKLMAMADDNPAKFAFRAFHERMTRCRCTGPMPNCRAKVG